MRRARIEGGRSRWWPRLGRSAATGALVALAACSSPSPRASIDSVQEIGTVPPHPGTGGGDVAFSAELQGRSTWIFGDTLFVEPAADGLRWRSSTWLWTTDLDSSDGVTGFEFAMGTDGKPLHLLPHTAEEATFNLAHEGQACAAGAQCGWRHTPWPGGIASDGQRAAIFYSNMRTGGGGAFDFNALSASVAVWADPSAPAVRVEPPLFVAEEPVWGAAAVLFEGDVYAYACKVAFLTAPCLVAKVSLSQVHDRSAYRFRASGGSWVEDWHEAVTVLDAAPLFGVVYQPALQQFTAFYMPPTSEEINLRTAPAPDGPWSEPVVIGQGRHAADDAWDYSLSVHGELAREGGKVQVLSYTRPSGFLSAETPLVEVRFR